MHHFQKPLLAASAIAALSASAAIAATTPYDLIRPTWPLSWDDKAFKNFVPNEKLKSPLPTEVVPPNFKAGELMADTVDQAYLDAINQHISPIRVNQAGYLESDKERQFYFVGDAKEFEVVDEMGKSLSTMVTGEFTATSYKTASDWTIKAGTDTQMSRYSINFTGPSGTIQIGNIPQSVPTETRLRIKVGNELSSTFIVSEDVYTMVKDAAIKFFGIQRSGNSESWFHGPSHTQDGAGPVKNVTGATEKSAELAGVNAGDLQGGWYDCGDHLKESLTMAYAFMSLAVMSATNPAKDVDHYAYNQADFVNTDNIPDMLREAKHGADFFLRAYRAAKGIIDDMPVSVGDLEYDHNGWTRPEFQDDVPADRGGASGRDVRLGELGANVSSEIAAGLAILGKDYAKYDKDFAETCLKVAEEMYDFAKNLALGNSTYGDGKKFVNNTKEFGTPARPSNPFYFDDLALASVALLYATGKEDYLSDALRSTDFAKISHTGAGSFAGGWFATGNWNDLPKGVENTYWSTQHTFALYALHKLILSDKDQAKAFGLTEEERLAAIEDCIADMEANLNDIGFKGDNTITLPKNVMKKNTVSYDDIWYTMSSPFNNSYYAGDIFDVMAYADVAADIEKQGITLPNMGSPEWKSSEMRKLGINQLNYLLGVNPWDISFVYGVGDKNDNHPHHRASNPEGLNIDGTSYKYVRPVGGLYLGTMPNGTNSLVPTLLSHEYYVYSSVCLDASTNLISSLTLVSNGGSSYYEKKCDNCDKGNTTSEKETKALADLYEFMDINWINLVITIADRENTDNLTANLYFEASEEDVENCNITFTSDICQAYDLDGYNNFCGDELEKTMRNLSLEKVEDTYNKENDTYTWALPIHFGNVDSWSKIRLDLGISKGVKKGKECNILSLASTVDISSSWSLTAHKAEDGKPAYEGTPTWDKEQCNTQTPPEDPYIAIYNGDKRIWGFGPKDVVETPKDDDDDKNIDDKDDGDDDDKKADNKDDGKSDDKKDDDKTDNKKEDGKKDDKDDGKKDGIIASIPSMHIGSLHVAGKTLIAQAPAQGSKTIKVFDLLGNEVMSEAFSGESATVNLSNVSKRGTLVARLVMEGKVLNTKAIRIK